MSGATYVPPEFFGIVSQDWPSVGTAPTFPFGRLSTFDNNRTHWRSLHTAINTINWTTLDTIVVKAKAAGVAKGTYVIYGCPQFLATKGTVASTGTDVLGPYGGIGEGAHPSSLAQLTYFCQQFAARNISVWGKFFDTVSSFNEVTLDPATVPGNGFFYWGTESQFIDLIWTVYSAFQAADPSLTVISPGFFRLDSLNDSGYAGLGYIANITGAVNTTKKGLDCYKGAALHTYYMVPEGKLYSGRGTINNINYGGLLQYKALIAAGQAINGPVHITEWGFSHMANTWLSSLLAMPPEYRDLYIQYVHIDAMLAGVKSICTWSFGNIANVTGNLSTDDPGVISGLRKVYKACAGKTIIVPSGITASGGRFLTFSDGTTYTV